MASSPHLQSRAFVRHPSDIPIRLHNVGRAGASLRRLHNVSEGGLACRSIESLPVGALVSVSIPLLVPPFSAQGEIVWCRRSNGCFELGVQFLERQSAYAARMVEQLCYIEHYRQEVLAREGRVLDSETAALEWIGKYAAGFPSMGTSH